MDQIGVMGPISFLSRSFTFISQMSLPMWCISEQIHCKFGTGMALRYLGIMICSLCISRPLYSICTCDLQETTVYKDQDQMDKRVNSYPRAKRDQWMGIFFKYS